jgi:hypothetical protein
MTTFRCPQCNYTYGHLTTSNAPTPPDPVRWVVASRTGWTEVYWDGSQWVSSLADAMRFPSELEALRFAIGTAASRVRAVRQRTGPRRWEECSSDKWTGTLQDRFTGELRYLREINPAPAGSWELVEPETV